MSEVAVFQAQNGRFVATELARGPWDPGAQHGGAPAALLMRAFERLPAAEGLTIARVTYEFLRPVPLGELTVVAEVVRPGRRVQLLEASVLTPDGTEVVRARALQVQRADGVRVRTPLVVRPARAGAAAAITTSSRRYRPMFAPDAMEIRFVAGTLRRWPIDGLVPPAGADRRRRGALAAAAPRRRR